MYYIVKRARKDAASMSFASFCPVQGFGVKGWVQYQGLRVYGLGSNGYDGFGGYDHIVVSEGLLGNDMGNYSGPKP